MAVLPTRARFALPTRRCFGLPTPTCRRRPSPSYSTGRRPTSAAPANRRSETAHLAFGLRAPEIVGRSSSLFRRLEHGPKPTGHLRQAQEGFCRDIAIVRQNRCDHV